jgi:hypothetical protein
MFRQMAGRGDDGADLQRRCAKFGIRQGSPLIVPMSGFSLLDPTYPSGSVRYRPIAAVGTASE